MHLYRENLLEARTMEEPCIVWPVIQSRVLLQELQVLSERMLMVPHGNFQEFQVAIMQGIKRARENYLPFSL